MNRNAIEQAGITATSRFIETFNSRDVAQWAASLHFPHVRPSPAPDIKVIDTAAAYIRRFNYDAILRSGWDHSRFDYQHVLQTATNKVHVAGQWSRYDGEGNKILTTPVTYVVTRVDGSWGIQARFGTNFAEDDQGLLVRATQLMRDYTALYNSGREAACAELLNYPHFLINPGEVTVLGSPDDFAIAEGASAELLELTAIQTGTRGANMALTFALSHGGETRLLEGVVNITIQAGHLGIQAMSLLDPQLPDE